MTIPAAVMVQLATLGLDRDQAESVAAMLSAVEDATRAEGEPGKEKARARWRKWREKHPRTNDEQRLQTLANDSKRLVRGDARVEDKTLPTEIEPQEEKQTAQSARVRDLAEFRSELTPHVDTDRIEAYIKHRRTKRGQNTGYAARLFLADAAACQLSPADAIDACISRNWITVKPEYNLGKGRGPPSHAPEIADVFAFVGRTQSDERPAEDISGSRALVSYLPVAGQRR